MREDKKTKKQRYINNLNDLEFEKEYGYIKIKGVYYKPNIKNGKITFTRVKNANEKITKAKEMAIKLKESLDGEKVLTESLMKLDDKDFEILYKSLKGKIKYRPKTREHHCVDMKIGNFVLPIVN